MLGDLVAWLMMLGRARLQLGKLLLTRGGTEGQLAHLQVASSTKAAVCQEERALGTATAIVPCAGAHFGALPSLSEVLWSSCCPRICGVWSVSTSDLS